MKHIPNAEDNLKRQAALMEEFKLQTDRGAAIVGAAWIEESIERALHDVLIRDDDSWRRLFGPNGPLGTFASKISLARLLGLMTDVIKSDLHIIRDIRNEFAHHITHKSTYEKLSFSSSHIRDKCFALKCISHEKPNEPRIAFIRACAILSADFELLPLFRATSLEGDAKVTAKSENAV